MGSIQKHSQDRFPSLEVSMDAVQNCLDELVDKSYIQRGTSDMYEYLP